MSGFARGRLEPRVAVSSGLSRITERPDEANQRHPDRHSKVDGEEE
jgi:hypothetical protein